VFLAPPSSADAMAHNVTMRGRHPDAPVETSPETTSRLLRFAETGYLEVLLAGLLAALALVLELATSQPWQVVALDLAVCAAAAATARWLRPAAVVLGVLLLVYLVVPDDWATLAEYAGLIPIIGTGVRGQKRERIVLSVYFLAVMTALSYVNTPAGGTPWFGPIIWAVIIAGSWVIGNSFAAAGRAERRSQQARQVLQRQALARELHDTLARSLGMISIAAERAGVHGGATPADLALIAGNARSAMGQLREVMVLLRDPAEADTMTVTSSVALDRALAAAAEDLRRHGFPADTTVSGDLAALSDQQSEVLAAAVGELAANVIRHGDPAQPCGIALDIAADTATLTVGNGTASPGSDGTAPAASLGLWGVRQRLETVAGTLSTHHDDHRWTTRVQVPLR
jgi:signal transduction histidine kinase